MKKNEYTIKMSEALMRQALQKKDEELASKDFVIALLKQMMCESCKKKLFTEPQNV